MSELKSLRSPGSKMISPLVRKFEYCSSAKWPDRNVMFALDEGTGELGMAPR